MEGMSYSWRSILKGIQLLKEGVIKKVGDGCSINVWQDPWVPRNGSPFLITSRGKVLIHRVSELLDPVSGTWDFELVEDCLWPADANYVKKIPVCLSMEDSWAWRMEPKGNFSVKSAYKLHRTLLEHIGSSSGGLPNEHAGDFAWKGIWSCPCPPNVRQFLWRITHDSLPHRCNIQRRGIEIDPLCLVCHRLNEDDAHVFLRCKGIRQAWSGLGMEDIRASLLLCNGPKEMLHAILQLDKNKMTKCVALLWIWWKHRNKINAGEGKLNIEEVVLNTTRCATEYEQFYVAPPVQSGNVVQKWS
jgi:hypothetical protein